MSPSERQGAEMKILIVEDDFSDRLLLQEHLKELGLAHVAINGKEAIEAVQLAIDSNEPYDLICMDILLPDMDGQQALSKIREMEEANGIAFSRGEKIIMTTALTDIKNKIQAFSSLCNGYLEKPIHKNKLMEELHHTGLV